MLTASSLNLTKMSPALLAVFHDSIHGLARSDVDVAVRVVFSAPPSPAEVWELDRVHGLQVDAYAAEVIATLPLDDIGFLSFSPYVGAVELIEAAADSALQMDLFEQPAYR